MKSSSRSSSRKKKKSMSEDFLSESKKKNHKTETPWNVVVRKKSLSFSGGFSSSKSYKKRKGKKKGSSRQQKVKMNNKNDRNEARERLWFKLFQNLNRSIDDIYDMVEFVSGVDECAEAIKILNKGAVDMRKLYDRIRSFASNDKPTQSSIAWEERRTSPLRHSLSDIMTKLRELEERVMKSSETRTSVAKTNERASFGRKKAQEEDDKSSSSSKRFDLVIEIDENYAEEDDDKSSTLVCSPKSAQELHKKLSSPERRKMSSQEAEKNYKKKEATAAKNLEKIKNHTKKRVNRKAEHMKNVSERKAQMEREKKIRVERKLRRAAENRDKHIEKIVSRAVRENSKVDDVRAETNFIESIVVKDLDQTLKTREKAAHERQTARIRSIVEKQRDVSKKVTEANERRKKNEERIAANQKKRLEEASRRREELLKERGSRLKSPTGKPKNVWAKSSPMSPPRLPAWARRHRDSKNKKTSPKKKKNTATSSSSSLPSSSSSLTTTATTTARMTTPIKSISSSSRDHSRTPSPKRRESNETNHSNSKKNSPERSSKSPSSRPSSRRSPSHHNNDPSLVIQGQKTTKLGMELVPLTKAEKKRCRGLRKRIKERSIELKKFQAQFKNEKFDRRVIKIGSKIKELVESRNFQTARTLLLAMSENMLEKIILRICASTNALDVLLSIIVTENSERTPRLVQTALSLASVMFSSSSSCAKSREWLITTKEGTQHIFSLLSLFQWALLDLEQRSGILEELLHLLRTVFTTSSPSSLSTSSTTITTTVHTFNVVDMMKLMVSLGVITRIGQLLGYSASELSSGELKSKLSPRLLHNALSVIVVISTAATQHKTAGSAALNSSMAWCCRDHVVEPIVLLLLSFLINGKHRVRSTPTFDMSKIAVVGFHALVNLTRSYPALKAVLNAPRLQNHFHHLLGQTFEFIEKKDNTLENMTRESEEEMLIECLLTLLTHYCLNNSENQSTLLWGKSPHTTLERICSLPFRYFNEPEYKAVLFPALIAACLNNETNTRLMATELSPELLAKYLTTVQGSHRKRLSRGIPESMWESAAAYFSKFSSDTSSS